MLRRTFLRSAASCVAFGAYAAPNLNAPASSSSGLFDAYAELPRRVPTAALPAVEGESLRLRGSGSAALQSAIDKLMALSGPQSHELVLDAGSIWTGNYAIPANQGTGWKIIRSDGVLPPAGQRVTARDAPQLARIQQASVARTALRTAALKSHHVALVGLEIARALGSRDSVDYGLLAIGQPDADQSSLEPHDFIIDRCYVHGWPDAWLRRGIALNCADAAIIGCTISDVHDVGADSQAICGWNGHGPYLIHNNDLQAAGQAIMFGGADPVALTPGMWASDVTISNNEMWKPTSWAAVNKPPTDWTNKTIFELKCAQRVLLEGNILHGSWTEDGWVGDCITLKSVNQNSTFTSRGLVWAETRDVTVRFNEVYDVNKIIDISQRPEAAAAVAATRFSIHDNLCYNIGDFVHAADGTGTTTRIMAFAASYISFRNNTVLLTTSSPDQLILFGDDAPFDGPFDFQNNILTQGPIQARGTATPLTSLNAAYPAGNWNFSGNVFIGTRPLVGYPPQNVLARSQAQVLDHTRQPLPPFQGRGADVVKLRQILANKV